MSIKDELSSLLAAGVPLVNLITYEEDRIVRLLGAIEAAEKLGITVWDIADGFRSIRRGEAAFPHRDCSPDGVLGYIHDSSPTGHIFVLRDFHQVWRQFPAVTTRKLRNMAPQLRARRIFLLFTTPCSELPAELRDDVVVTHVPLPDEEELTALFDKLTAHLLDSVLPDQAVKERLISSALGLTTNQARLAFSRVMARYRCFDDRGIEIVTSTKREIIRENGALEYWPAEEGEASVGGLEALKAWLKKRAVGFTPLARAAHVPYPRGVALIGIPGTGKSLCAKLLSGLWKMPLLRLDVGALFGAYVGESEGNMRQAIQLAETVSPCILWIDEMEKAFAGSSVAASGLSSGAASRVFGTFLTWMQERKSPVFVFATANDVEGLPPELMSRFDRTFFLDLPRADERKQIFSIHLSKAGEAFPERRFELKELVERTKGFVGREIEQVVREAQFTALADEHREVRQEDLLHAIDEVVPLSKSHAEVIEEIRRWRREGRAFAASYDGERH